MEAFSLHETSKMIFSIIFFKKSPIYIFFCHFFKICPATYKHDDSGHHIYNVALLWGPEFRWQYDKKMGPTARFSFCLLPSKTNSYAAKRSCFPPPISKWYPNSGHKLDGSDICHVSFPSEEKVQSWLPLRTLLEYNNIILPSFSRLLLFFFSFFSLLLGIY